MLKLAIDSTVYIICMANKATGGPELLHQLAYTLKNQHINVRMVYTGYKPDTNPTPVHDNYAVYQIPYVFEIEDNSKNMLIVPEISLNILSNYANINKVIWWLSIDHALYQFELTERLRNSSKFWQRSILSKIVKNCNKIPGFSYLYKLEKDRAISKWSKQISLDSAIYHLAQSHYALDFLRKHNFNRYAYLSDYLRIDYLDNAKSVDIKNKQDIVVYNPQKGIRFTKKIIAAAKGQIKFVPLENMSYTEVTELLSIAKVYIDFGEHPGKDRIPREAAIMKCCVITGQRGSAGFAEDVGVPDKYKFADIKRNIPRILATIKNLFAAYDTILTEYTAYRQSIYAEPEVFHKDVCRIFKFESLKC